MTVRNIAQAINDDAKIGFDTYDLETSETEGSIKVGLGIGTVSSVFGVGGGVGAGVVHATPACVGAGWVQGDDDAAPRARRCRGVQERHPSRACGAASSG